MIMKTINILVGNDALVNLGNCVLLVMNISNYVVRSVLHIKAWCH